MDLNTDMVASYVLLGQKVDLDVDGFMNESLHCFDYVQLLPRLT